MITIAPAVGGGTDTSELHLDFDSLRTKFFARGRFDARRGHARSPCIRASAMRISPRCARRSRRAASAWARAGATRRPRARRAPATLFTIHSPPLREILPALLKPSQNQIAELLFKTLGLEKTGVGSADSGQAVIERQLLAWGAAPDGFRDPRRQRALALRLL